MTISPALRVFAWLSFIAEVIIIGTGGAVRLTGSGLGCDQWPLCTPGSLVPTQELGIHGLIEFGNRTMTGAVGILALLVLLFALAAAGGRRAVVPALVVMSVALLLAVLVGAAYSLKTTPVRRDLLTLAWVVLAGVMAQAVVGGSAVLTGLNPFIVGFHYASSLALVCVTAAFLVRMNTVPGARELATPRWYMILTHVTSLVLAVTIAFGVLTTANGPHSGDANVERNGFDASVLAHVHSWPGYTLFALALVLVVVAWARSLPTRGWATAFIVVLVVQIVVGVIQARDALPPLLVGIHMVLAALSAAAYVVLVFRLKRPTGETVGR
jgi:cytochrome c oxidase assembly protein subunit 15